MNMGHHVLPSARRVRPELDRYVRTEYRETDSCWLTSSTGGCAGVRRIGGEVKPGAPALDAAVVTSKVRCCPVTGAIPGSGPVNKLSRRGGPTGDR